MKTSFLINFNALSKKKITDTSPSISRDIKNFLYYVNEEIAKSKKLKKEFIEGKDVPVYEIMIQAQKAKISFELLMKLRDEALKAYNIIINMRI